MTLTPREDHILVCADDFGADASSDSVMLALLDEGGLDATTCLVGASGWKTSAPALRELADAKGAPVGLHLNLTQARAEQPAAAVFAPIAVHVARAFLPRDRKLEQAIGAEFQRQWDIFNDALGRAPDFIDGHEHVHLFPMARSALFGLCERRGFTGWLRQCRSSAPRWNTKRLILDPFSAQFAREAQALGYTVNRGFGGLRRFHPAEDLETTWRTDFAAMRSGGVLMVHPGAADGTGAGACRVQEAALLSSGWMARTRGELGLT